MTTEEDALDIISYYKKRAFKAERKLDRIQEIATDTKFLVSGAALANMERIIEVIND